MIISNVCSISGKSVDHNDKVRLLVVSNFISFKNNDKNWKNVGYDLCSFSGLSIDTIYNKDTNKYKEYSSNSNVQKNSIFSLIEKYQDRTKNKLEFSNVNSLKKYYEIIEQNGNNFIIYKNEAYYSISFIPVIMTVYNKSIKNLSNDSYKNEYINDKINSFQEIILGLSNVIYSNLDVESCTKFFIKTIEVIKHDLLDKFKLLTYSFSDEHGNNQTIYELDVFDIIIKKKIDCLGVSDFLKEYFYNIKLFIYMSINDSDNHLNL